MCYVKSKYKWLTFRWTDVIFAAFYFSMDVSRKWALLLLPVTERYALFASNSSRGSVSKLLVFSEGHSWCQTFQCFTRSCHEVATEHILLAQTKVALWSLFLFIIFACFFHGSLIWNLPDWWSLCSQLQMNSQVFISSVKNEQKMSHMNQS